MEYQMKEKNISVSVVFRFQCFQGYYRVFRPFLRFGFKLCNFTRFFKISRHRHEDSQEFVK